MARIPDSELERLKKEIPIERLVMGFGVELKRHGAELIGTYPFHDGKTPSLIVSPKSNLWHCEDLVSQTAGTLGLIATTYDGSKTSITETGQTRDIDRGALGRIVKVTGNGVATQYLARSSTSNRRDCSLRHLLIFARLAALRDPLPPAH